MVSKAKSEWKLVNLPKQFAYQNSIWQDSNFWIRQIRISKITFDFSKQLERLPTWKLFNFLSSTTFMLTTFQNSKWILNWRFKLEKGTLSGNLYFQNYLEFYIETSKTQNTKVVYLYKIYNFSFGLNLKFCLVFKLWKRGNSRVQKLGFFPLIFRKRFTLGF